MTRNQKLDVPTLPLGAAKGTLRDNLEIVLFAVALITFFKTFVGQQFGIPSASMRNTLMIGDHLLANKFIFAVPQWNWETKLFPMRKVERGDIIVFRYPMDREMDYVKRCVAVPGDRVEVRGKRLYVNGKLITGTFEHHGLTEMGQPEPGPWPLERNAGPTQYQQALEAAKERNALPVPPPSWAYDPALYPESVNVDRQGMLQLGNDPRQPFYFRDDLAPFTVPEGNIMAMGDNRDRSADSRYWGLLPMDHLRGRPFIIWWSYQEGGNDDTRANTSENPGDVLSNAADVLVHGFSRTRWKRTGTIPK